MKYFLHRNDLRIHDNIGIASLSDQVFQPIYIFDEEYWKSNKISNQRKMFILQSLQELQKTYESHGNHLHYFLGNPTRIAKHLQQPIVFNKDANTLNQDFKTYLRKNHVGINNQAIQFQGRQSNWAKQAKKYFQTQQIKPNIQENPKKTRSKITLQHIKKTCVQQTKKELFEKGGRKKALRRLQDFQNRVEKYMKNISSPSKAEKMTSHLSPYIRFGCISLREVYQAFEKNTFNVNSFRSRLFWHQNFRQKLEDNPTLFKEAINPVYKDLHKDNTNKKYVEAWKKGKTGYPLVDASMRALKQTGWMNFRMRALCASFYSYILKQWWIHGANHYFKHLIDADVAINYYQWQMQSGLVGIHANRIYNPTKQVFDNDKQGIYIKKYVPELRNVPAKHIAEPWKLSKKQQETYKCILGHDYPKPIVRFEKEAKKARAYFKRNASKAYAAFKKDEVWKKASLSNKHARKKIIQKSVGDHQRSLDSF